MRTQKFSILGLLFVSLSLLGLPVVAETPVNEGVCNDLMGSTPGLYGLCVAFCEAQDCSATYDPATNEMVYDPSCKPSSPKILAKFNERAGVGGPTMPCVNPVETECKCWTEAELDLIADGTLITCGLDFGFYRKFGTDSGGGFEEVVTGILTNEGGLGCSYLSVAPTSEMRFFPLTEQEYQACVSSIEAECSSQP